MYVHTYLMHIQLDILMLLDPNGKRLSGGDCTCPSGVAHHSTFYIAHIMRGRGPPSAVRLSRFISYAVLLCKLKCIYDRLRIS